MNKKKRRKLWKRYEVLLARAEELQKKERGEVMLTEVFIEKVADRVLTDYDGGGHLVDFDGNAGKSVEFDEWWLNSMKEQFPFVVWISR